MVGEAVNILDAGKSNPQVNWVLEMVWGREQRYDQVLTI